MASLPTAVRSTAPKIARSALQRRTISDVHITRTGKPIVRVQGGRSVTPSLPPECPLTVMSLQFLPGRAHRHRLRRHGPARPLHCQPARSARPVSCPRQYRVLPLQPRLTRPVLRSETRMHRRGAVPRGDGEAPSQGHRRPGPCCLHCEGLGRAASVRGTSC